MFNAVDPAEERDDGLVARMARLVGGMPRRGPALLDAWRAPAAPQPQPSALVDAIPKEIPSLYDAQDRPTPQLPKPSLIDKSAAALSNSMWQQGPTAWPQAVASPVNRLWQTLKDSADVAGRKLGLPDWMLERKTFDPVGSFTTGAERLAGRLADAGSDFGRGMIERDPAGRAAMNEIRGDVGRFQSIQDRMMAGDMKAASELTDPRLMLPNMSSLVPSLVSGYVMGPWKGAAVSTMADAAQELRQHEQETGKAVSPAEAAKFFATRAIEIPSEALSNKLTLAPKPGIGRVPAAVTATLADPATEAWQRWLENLAMKSTFKPDQSLTEGLLQEAAGAGPGSGAVAAFTAKPSVADARSAQAPAYRPTDLTAAMLDAIRTQGALNAPQQINQQPGPLPQRRGTGIELQADRTDRQLPPPDAGGGGETGIGNRVPGAAGGAQTALTDRAQFNYEPSRGLSDEERAIEQRFAQSIGSDVDRAVANYERANTQNGTLVINTDQARDLSEDYNRDIESRSLYAAAVHEPASALVKKVWRAALDRPPAPGKEANVIFTAGGTGAGKTTAIDNVPAIAQLRDASDIIYDGNLNNFDKAVQRIEEALASGRTADIVYVYRDPVEAMRNGALTRAERQGRTVRIDAHADSHIGSLKVVGQLMEHYKGDPRVNIVVLDNSHGPGGAVETTIDKLPAWEYDALAQELINVVQADYEAGRISDRVYRGTLGQRAAIPRGTEPRLQEGDSGKPQPQRTLQPEEAAGPVDRALGVFGHEELYEDAGEDGAAPKAGQPFLAYRVGTNGLLEGRNAGSAQGVAAFLADADDFTGPTPTAKGTHLYAYRVVSDNDVGRYAAYNMGRTTQESFGVGRAIRHGGATYSFAPSGGYSYEVIGKIPMSEVRRALKVAGFEDFDDAGSIEGGKFIHKLFSEPVDRALGVAEVPKHVRGWVRDYQAARHYGNLAMARSLKASIDNEIRSLGISSADVYGEAPEIKSTRAKGWAVADDADRAQGVGEASAFYGRNAIDSLEVGSNKSDHPAIDYRLPGSMGQRRNVNPPDSIHQRMLNAAAHDIEAAGFPLRAAMQAVKGVVTYNGSYSNWHAAWLPDHRVVAFSEMRLIEMEGADARQRYLRGWMAHELTHAIDDAGNGSISSGSPRLDFFVAGDTVVTKGDIVTEVAEAYTKGGKIGEFFEYPFAYAKEFSPALMKEELLAQLSRLYTTNRELMRKELPASFKMMEEWYAQIQPDSLAATRAGLQAALRTPGARLGGQERQFHGIDQAVPRADRGVLGVGQPGAGMATGRATAAGGQGAVTGAQPDLFQSAYSGEKYAINLNLDRYDTAGAIKGLIEATAKNITDKASRGETATHEKTLAEADRLGISEDQVLAEARKGGKPMSLPEARAYALAVRQLIVTRAEATKHYAETAFKSGNSQDRAEAMASLYHLAALQAVGMNLSAEAGRLLNSYRILAGVTTGDRMSDAVFDEERQKTAEQVLEQMFGGTNNIDDILSKVALMSTQQLASPKMRKALLSRRPSAFLEIWKAGLLSGPQTHIVNMASNALTSLIRAPETAVAAVIGKLHGGDKVYFRETAALMAGMTAGTMIGARDAWQIMRYGEDANAAGKSETTGKAITGENFGLTGRVGKAVDVAGEVVRTPFRALAAEDAIFKGVNRTGTLYALAYRQAIKEGAKNVSMRARELVANPTRKMTKAALEDGLYFTFNNQLGTAGQKMLDILHSTRIGKLAQFAVVPFFRTPVNILKFGIHRSPLAPLTQHFQDEIKAGGARRDMAIAQMMTGTAIMTAVFSLAASGLVTGGGEPEKERKAADRIAGWRPYSIRIGNKFFEYRRLEPLGMLLGMAADIYELSDYMSREESEQWVKMAGMAMAQNVTSKTFLQQLTNLMKAISEPQQYGDNYLGAMVGSFVPGVVAQAARARDPWERDTDPDKNLNGLAYAWDDVKRDIMARIPGQREKLPLRRDALGQPMPITDSPSMFNPIRTGELRTGDPVAMELASARARVSPAKDTIKGVRLTPEEKEAYGQASGTVARARLERLFASPGYQALPEFLKDEKISKEMAKARTDVRNAIVQGLPVERRVEAKVRQLRR